MKSMFSLAALLALAVSAQAGLLSDTGFDGTLVIHDGGTAVDSVTLGQWYAPGSGGWNQCWDISGGVGLYPNVSFEFNQSLAQMIASPGVGSYGVTFDLNVVSSGQIYLFAAGMNSGQAIGEGLMHYYTNATWVSEFNGGGAGADPTSGWETFTYTLNITQATDYLVIGINAADGANLQVDNVDVTPEPASMSLLGLGALALIRRRR